jgi:Phosphate-selective porin O and P
VTRSHQFGQGSARFAPTSCYIHRPGRAGSGLAAAIIGASLLAAPLSRALADDISLPPISIGAGVRTDFEYTDPTSGKKSDDFNLDSIRLYISGHVMDHISFMFNTEYEGSPPAGTNAVEILDAVAQFSWGDSVNIWAGRFLPPSDRANLYGPYYANQWAVYRDGVQDGFPSTAVGRDNGVMYWGDFGIFKVAVGEFDVPSTVGTTNVVSTARVMVDLWDKEQGYYLNGTYYGEKDLLAIGVDGQAEDGNKAYSADFLMEKKLPNGGVVDLESEYAKYDHFGGYAGDESDGYYVLASYLFPQVVGIGKFEPLAKYAHANYQFDTSTASLTAASTGPILAPGQTDTQMTVDLELNYIIKAFNARLSLYYLDIKYENELAGASQKVLGLGLQLQM